MSCSKATAIRSTQPTTAAMSHEYAPQGFIGLFTPQANTCVEAECAILLPPGIGSLTSRLISARATIEERLVDYIDTLESKAREFANVPLRALGFACTGSSYLAGRDREDELLARLSAQLKCHVTSSAVAVVDALRSLGAERIALVSPYSDNLTQNSIAYWNSRGFSVGPVAKVVGNIPGGMHPIYGLESGDALRALETLRGSMFDAVVLLGTGMPTLRALIAHPQLEGAPVFSCTFALVWRCVRALEGAPASGDSLRAWIAGGEGGDWRERYRQLLAQPAV